MMLIVFFFDAEGVIHREFVPEWAESKCKILRGCFGSATEENSTNRTAKLQSSEWFLFHDNSAIS